MRTLRNIFAIIALLSAASCAVDNVDAPSHGVNSSDVVTVLGRMTRFDEKDVTTRGVKNENEAKLTSMAVAIFPVNADGTALSGPCAHWQYTDNQAELLFEINRSGIGFTPNTRYAMYVFCNMPELEDFGIGSSLEAMLTTAQKVSGINIPEKGFPMMGSLGDTFSTAFDRDNQILILSPTKNNELIAPTVDGDTQTLLTIPMKAMYAKVNFSIEVRPDQTIEGHYSPQFELKGYTVKNVPSEVDLSKGTNSDSEVLDNACTLGVSGNTVASGANKINFTFYLPERLLSPTNNTSTKPYDYTQHGFEKRTDWGSQIDANGNGYRDEDEDYFQRFKSKMLGDNQKATNIVLYGQFRDHQNHYWDVNYTIYLGENNSTDFNIKRNSEYNNYVTIRGIQSSDDMSDNQNGIAIDHRVNVERTQPAIISLRREVLLDSHFEVRPLRIRKSNVEDIPNDITHVKVEVVNYGSAKDKSGTWWMRLERSFGVGGDGEGMDDIYIKDGVSAGKRKYFTFDLITGNGTATLGDLAPLTESTEVIVPLNEGEQCVWIYVDECTEVGDAVRAGIVKVSYGKLVNGTFEAANNATYPDVSYVINQRKLFEVKYDDPSTTTDENRKYHIEYEEEYLHNFDADDNYGQTEYKGMKWGLEGLQLSYPDNSNGDGHFAVIADTGDDWISEIINGFMNYFISSLHSFYDFYIKKHDSGIMSKEENLHDRKGWDFCNEIIQVANGYGYNVPAAKPENTIDVLALNEQPKSAIEYCYNKNKRNRNGQVAWTGNTDNLNWYLPAIDEMEDIVMSKYGGGLYTYARFIDFQGEYYWSSQPSFNKNLLHYNAAFIARITADYDYYVDDVLRARATRVVYDTSFHEESSSVTGIREVVHLRGTNNIKPYNLEELLKTQESVSYTYDYTGSWGNKTRTFTKSDLISRKPGNQPRTEKNRIRCVRKSQYTKTSAN